MDPATSLYSCDDHLDLRAVPPDLWASRLPSELRERGPRVIDRDGQRVWVCEDRMLGGSGRPANSALAKSLSAIGRAGIEDDGYRPGNPKLRLEDMDLDGLRASVIYGPLALGYEQGDLASVSWLGPYVRSTKAFTTSPLAGVTSVSSSSSIPTARISSTASPRSASASSSHCFRTC